MSFAGQRSSSPGRFAQKGEPGKGRCDGGVSFSTQRIGVFVCWCGSNIAATVNVSAVAAAVKNEPGGCSRHRIIKYMCSPGGPGRGQDRDGRQRARAYGVVVCSCRRGCMKRPSAKRRRPGLIRIWSKLQISASVLVDSRANKEEGNGKGDRPGESGDACQAEPQRSADCRESPV